MSYSKHTWVTDEVITAEKVNRIEDGVEGNSDAIATLQTASETMSDNIADAQDNIISLQGNVDDLLKIGMVIINTEGFNSEYTIGDIGYIREDNSDHIIVTDVTTNAIGGTTDITRMPVGPICILPEQEDNLQAVLIIDGNISDDSVTITGDIDTTPIECHYGNDTEELYKAYVISGLGEVTIANSTAIEPNSEEEPE